MNAHMLTCQKCGKGIAKRPYGGTEENPCCEHCCLQTMVPHTAYSRQFEVQALLAEVLIATLDLREHETGLHSKRVACHTLVLAKHCTSDPEQLLQIYWGALLHDIGKIGIPDAVLLKTTRLTALEWEEMRTHPDKGYQIVIQVPGLKDAAEIVLCHEERYDGTGYPRGLVGDAIPTGARLFAVIDTLDAMTSDRVYRKAVTFDEARDQILGFSGSQFDPMAVQIFIKEEQILRKMVELKCGLENVLK